MAIKTTEQAFADLQKLRVSINHAKQAVKEVVTAVEAVEGTAKEILDDPKRLAELKKILDIHPTYTATEIKAEITKLIALKEKLV